MLRFVILAQQLSVLKMENMLYKGLLVGINAHKCFLDHEIIIMKPIYGA